MKARDLNRSSENTKKQIKKVFAEMLAEHKQLNKISVSELTSRAGINRSTFYSHYDDVYGVAEDYEFELVNRFFADCKSPADFEGFIDSFFGFLKANDRTYKLLCSSNDSLLAAKRLADISTKKFIELASADKNLKTKNFLYLEINVFVNGLICEYLKYCRNTGNVKSIDELYLYAKHWHKNFVTSAD